jgi:hypothetical protein
MLTMTSSVTRHLDDFQDALHQALQHYLNGRFVVSGGRRLQLIRPLNLAACRVPWDVLARPVALTGRADGDGAHDRLVLDGTDVDLAEKGRRQGWVSATEAARLLAGLHTVLKEVGHRAAGGRRHEVQVLRRFDPTLYRERGLRVVEALADAAQRRLRAFAVGVYLHGSLSTLDYTDYSDLDDFVVLREETVLDPDALRRCAEACVAASRLFYEHDPLHHHGHYVVTELDLLRYSTAYLPPEVLEFATVLTGAERLSFEVRDAAGVHRAMLRHIGAWLSRWGDGRPEPSNLWRLKYVTSLVMLVPVLYLETRGTFCYKKFSFDLARPAFADAWTAVEMASEIRRTWSYRPAGHERLLRAAVLRWLRNPPLFEHLMARRAQPVPSALEAMLRERRFIQAVRHFGDAALRLAGDEEAAG